MQSLGSLNDFDATLAIRRGLLRSGCREVCRRSHSSVSADPVLQQAVLVCSVLADTYCVYSRGGMELDGTFRLQLHMVST